jgi:RNA polymerase sigma-70 factor (ECF subfamily)
MQATEHRRLACTPFAGRDTDAHRLLEYFPVPAPAVSLSVPPHFALAGRWLACYVADSGGSDQPLSAPSPNPPDDAVLLRDVAGRNREAFRQLYERHSGVLFSLALKILGDRTEAEDVLQDTFLKVWNAADAFDATRAKPLGWLIMLTRSRAIDRLRSRQTRARLTGAASEAPRETEPTPSEQAATSESHGIVRRALESLPAEQRTPIELAYFAGLTQTEIAQQLGQPLGTIKTRMRTGMTRLRDLLEAQP